MQSAMPTEKLRNTINELLFIRLNIDLTSVSIAYVINLEYVAFHFLSTTHLICSGWNKI